MGKGTGEEIMYKKSLIAGLFLVAISLFIGVICLTAGAANVYVSDSAKTMWIEDDADYDPDDVYGDADVDDTMLWEESTDVWRANYSVIINASSQLRINPTDGCTWFKLAGVNDSGLQNAHINVTGKLWVNDSMVTGWNATSDSNFTWEGIGLLFRPYIYIHPLTDADDTHCSFINSTIGYLGFDKDNMYGIVYEDVEGLDPTGWMHNCTVMENFIGINFQGCRYMNVTNTWMNHTHEVGIVYTVSSETGEGSHDGYIGDHLTWTHRAAYTSVAVDYCSGALDAMGIRLCHSNNITLDEVNIQDAYTDGLWIEDCDSIDADNVTCYLNTNAADDFNIYLYDTGNSTFNNCTTFNPDGAADGGNWMIAGDGTTNSNYNNFTDCIGYGSIAGTDFHNWKSYNNYFTRCNCSDSDTGFYIEYGHNNTLTDCEAKTHVSYNYKLWGTPYNTITNGYANSSAVGLLIADEDDSDVSHHNTITTLEINTATGYGISVGTDGGTDNWCHNNTIDTVTIYGTITGDGIFFFDNVTYNNATECFVTNLDHANSCAFGMSNDAHHNTFHDGLAYDNENTGFILMQAANYNSILGCTVSLCQEGLGMSGDDIHNNTINDLYSHHNDWGLWAWSSASNNNKDNYINNSRFQFNTYAGIDIGRIGLSTYYNNIVKNNSNGVEVRQGAEPFFSLTLSYNSTNYDWVIEDTSAIDIYSTHILYPSIINTVGSATASISHDAGDGYWNLTTMPMTITIDAGTCDINVSQYTDSFVQWTGTALAGDLTQYIGSLRQGRVYDLLVDGATTGRASAQEATMLENTTYRVTFPYTDGWSTKTFAVRLVTGGGEGGTPQDDDGEPEQDSDGDGWTDAEEIAAGSDPYDATSTPVTVAAVPAFLGLDWYWWVAIAAVIFFAVIMPIYFILYPAQWKKFKKLLGF